MSKERFYCTIPFNYSEVFENRHYLCCPGWLTESVYSSGNIQKDFFNEKSNSIRSTILDGSYKYCSSTQCPHLSAIEKGKHIDGRFVRKNDANRDFLLRNTKLTNINLCFDESCNYKCPSCRLDFINFKGSKLVKVEDKLKQVEEELAPYLQKITVTGGGDPFFSNSFRKFLLRFNPKIFPKLKNIHLLTNGSLWTESLWKKLTNIHPYVETCEISIDAASKETYENKVRLGGDWNKLLENLNFITSIPTIKSFTFSFVTQDSNFKEMINFCKLFNTNKNLEDKNYTIFFNRITNWGTFSEADFKFKDVSNPEHKKHTEFLEILNEVAVQPNVLHNFDNLIDVKKSLI